jgi:hypothetical protein
MEPGDGIVVSFIVIHHEAIPTREKTPMFFSTVNLFSAARVRGACMSKSPSRWNPA